MYDGFERPPADIAAPTRRLAATPAARSVFGAPASGAPPSGAGLPIEPDEEPEDEEPEEPLGREDPDDELDDAPDEEDEEPDDEEPESVPDDEPPDEELDGSKPPEDEDPDDGGPEEEPPDEELDEGEPDAPEGEEPDEDEPDDESAGLPDPELPSQPCSATIMNETETSAHTDRLVAMRGECVTQSTSARTRTRRCMARRRHAEPPSFRWNRSPWGAPGAPARRLPLTGTREFERPGGKSRPIGRRACHLIRSK